jgi:hypothetical protein
VDQIWNAVAENPHITTVKSFNTAQSFVSLPNVVQTSQSIRQLSISNMIYGRPEPNADQLVAAIRTNSTLEDVHVYNMGRQDNWAVDVLSVLGSHSSIRKLHVDCMSAGAIVNATASVVRSTHSLQCLELSFIFDEEWPRVILEALRSNQTVSSLKLALRTRFDKEATSDFVHFIRHECNRNGNVLRELVLEKPVPFMFGVESLETTPGKVVASMLQGSALEALSFPGSVCFRDNDDAFGAADLFQGLLHPTVTLPSLRLSMLDGPDVNDFVRFLAATTCLQHLTIVRLEQMHDICSLMSACRQNGSLHSISIAHATENDTESSAKWASLHAWFVRRTMAFLQSKQGAAVPTI